MIQSEFDGEYITSDSALREKERQVVEEVTTIIQSVKGADPRDLNGMTSEGTDLAYIRGLIEEEDISPEVVGHTEGSGILDTLSSSTVDHPVPTPDAHTTARGNPLVKVAKTVHAKVWAPLRGKDSSYQGSERNFAIGMTVGQPIPPNRRKKDKAYRDAMLRHSNDPIEGLAAIDDLQQNYDEAFYDWERGCRGKEHLPLKSRPPDLTQHQQDRIHNRVLKQGIDGSSANEAIANAAVTHALGGRETAQWVWDRDQRLKENPLLLIPTTPCPHELTDDEMEAVYAVAFAKRPSDLYAQAMVQKAVVERMVQVEEWQQSYERMQAHSGAVRLSQQLVGDIVAGRSDNIITKARFFRMSNEERGELIQTLGNLLAPQAFQVGGPDPGPETARLRETFDEMQRWRDQLEGDQTGSARLEAVILREAAGREIAGYNPNELTAIIFCEARPDATTLLLASLGYTQIFMADGRYQQTTLAALARVMPPGVRIFTPPYVDEGIMADMVVANAHHVTVPMAFEQLRVGGKVLVSGSPDMEGFREEARQNIRTGVLKGITAEPLLSGRVAVGSLDGSNPPHYPLYDDSGYVYIKEQ
jgi:hypothetical protein